LCEARLFFPTRLINTTDSEAALRIVINNSLFVDVYVNVTAGNFSLSSEAFNSQLIYELFLLPINDLGHILKHTYLLIINGYPIADYSAESQEQLNNPPSGSGSVNMQDI